MTMTDPIADMLTRIRNANMVKHETLELPASNIKKQIAEILKQEGSSKMQNTSKITNKEFIKISLKYSKGERVIKGIKRISKPGLRVYAKADELPRVLNGLGIAIVSTSNGVVTDKVARKNNTGGEVLAYIW